MNANIQFTIDATKKVIASLETVRLVNTIASHNHVVMSAGGFALAFDFVDNGNGTKTATNARQCELQKAPQFTKKDAQTLAARAVDGNGNAGRAVFINDAIDEMAASLCQFIETLEQMEMAA